MVQRRVPICSIADRSVTMSTVRLDEEKLEALRSWGERLRQAGGEESAAVGRAILMLVEEIDRLHIELWHARIQPSGGTPVETDGPSEDEEEPVASSLHARLQRLLRRDPASPAGQSVSDADEDGASSAKAWMAALRREE
jgi:hypothetical protein